jgi:hypothetical protein
VSPLGKRPRTPRSGAPAPSPTPLPDAGQGVDLHLPAREQLSARAVRAEADEILLVLMLDARDPLRPGEVSTMEIEFTARNGLVRLEGNGTVESDDLLNFRLEGAVEVQQRRDFVRVQAVRSMAIAPVLDDDATGDWIDTLTVNLSGNGVLAAGPDTLQLEDRVRFRIRLAEHGPDIEGEGSVVRITDEGQRGIRVEQLADDDCRQLVHFIFERERIARRLMRDGDL